MSALPAVPGAAAAGRPVGLVRPPDPGTRRTRDGCGSSRTARRPPSAWRWSRSPWCGPPTSSSTRGCAGSRPRTCRTSTGCAGCVVDVAAVPGAVPGRHAHPVRLRGPTSRRASCSAGTYEGSLWYYLPAALLVKTPLGMLALWLGRRRRGPRGCAGCGPRRRTCSSPRRVLLAVAMNGARDFGVRYAIFVPMFLAVAAGRCAAPAPAVGARSRRPRWCCFVAVSSLRTYPYYLPYSNEAFGGPSKTHLRLHDSNVDWGQDLGRLADRLRQRLSRRAGLARLQGRGRAVLLRHRRGRPAQGARRTRCTGCSSCPTPRSPRPTGGWPRCSTAARRSTRSATRSRSTAGPEGCPVGPRGKAGAGIQLAAPGPIVTAW